MHDDRPRGCGSRPPRWIQSHQVCLVFLSGFWSIEWRLLRGRCCQILHGEVHLVGVVEFFGGVFIAVEELGVAVRGLLYLRPVSARKSSHWVDQRLNGGYGMHIVIHAAYHLPKHVTDDGQTIVIEYECTGLSF